MHFLRGISFLHLSFEIFIVSAIVLPQSTEYLYHEKLNKHVKINKCNLSNDYGNYNEFIKLFGTADINALNTGGFEIKSNLNVTTAKEPTCPSMDGVMGLTQEQCINILTAPCRYDRFKRPLSRLGSQHPLNIIARSVISELRYETINARDLKLGGLMQLRYTDPRLAFGNFVSVENQLLFYDNDLQNKIWIPKINVVNKFGLSVVEPNNNQRISLLPDGSVTISFKFETKNNCWIKKEAFPFDVKQCSTYLKSYDYNSSQVLLSWAKDSPILIDPQLKQDEFKLTNSWGTESTQIIDVYGIEYDFFSGNYSSLSFTINLTREVDLYLMDYFFPSMMIVGISWVSFWLQPDQTPARTTLGTSTMLSFITLSSAQGKNLPKVNFIDISDVWFLGCTFFIFGSLIEFAFVNNIWRRHKNIHVKKIKSKYVFKSTLIPSSKQKLSVGGYRLVTFKRKNILKPDDSTVIYVTEDLQRQDDTEKCTQPNKQTTDEKYLSDSASFSKMTPHEISLWIDKKARFIFPLAFVIFNGIFWTILYCL